MPFKKGHKLSKGRIKGSTNKSASIVKENFSYLLENNLNKLQEDLDEMKPEARFNALMTLAKYVIPTLKSQDVNIGNGSFNPVKIVFNGDK